MNHKILCIGYGIETFNRLCTKGLFPSQLLYGMAELKKKGLDINYYQIPSNCNLFKAISIIIKIIKKRVTLLIFPYNQSNVLFIILLLKYIGIYNIKIIGIQHCSIKANYLKRIIYRKLYTSFNQIFFHSPLNMQECIKSRIVSKDKAELLNWGVDINFYEKKIMNNYTDKEPYFISTGMEHRDFKTLINGAILSNCRTKIYIPESQKNNYDIFNNKANNSVEINYVIQKNDTIKYLAQKVQNSYAVIIIIESEFCTYCVGHTTMVEAMTLGKPIIVTKNNYHPINVDKLGIGITVNPNNPEELSNAIKYLYNNPQIAKQMGDKGKKLAKEKYNIEICSDQIYKSIISL